MKISESDNKSNEACSAWWIDAVATALLLCFAAGVIGYCIWTLDRGFEITDEAYYFLLAIHAGSQKLYVSAQHWITGWMWQLTGSLVLFRALGLGTLLFTSSLLALGTYSVCVRLGVFDESVQAKAIIIGSTVVSALLYVSTINFSPCYNLLASSGGYAAAGLVLLALQRVRLVPKYALYACAGGAVGVEALCKASAGVATFLILMFWLVRFERSRSHQILGAVVIASAAIIFGVVSMFANTTIAGASESLSQGLRLFRIVQVEAIHARLFRYTIQFFQLVLATGAAFAIPLGSVALYVKTKRPGFAQLALLTLPAILYFDGYWKGGWNNGSSFTPPFALVAMLCMALALAVPAWRGRRPVLELGCGLILLPYSVAMGTGNTLFSQCIVSLASWGALVGMLMCARFQPNAAKVCMSFLGLCFVATVSSQIVTSGLRPYHLSAALPEQSQPITIGNLGTVRVDAETRTFVLDIEAAARNCNILPGSPFLGLYNDPGVALALQATPIQSPWLNNRAQAEFVLRRTQPQELQSVVIALNTGSAGIQPEMPRQLRRFPSAYKYCGTATYPFGRQKIQIWQYPGS